jgi:hypothetical protein
MRFAIGLFMILALLSKASAVETGADAQKSCGRVAQEKLGKTIIEAAAAGHCLGILSAVWVLGSHLQENMRFCIPEGAKPEQGNKVFLKYLADHPQTIHEPDVLLAVLAFHEAWPCHKSN